MESPEATFDAQLSAAGAAVEVASNMSAFANHLLYRADEAAIASDIEREDPRIVGLRDLLATWEEKIAPGFAQATQKDPTGARGTASQRPWRDPRLVSA